MSSQQENENVVALSSSSSIKSTSNSFVRRHLFSFGTEASPNTQNRARVRGLRSPQDRKNKIDDDKQKMANGIIDSDSTTSSETSEKKKCFRKKKKVLIPLSTAAAVLHSVRSEILELKKLRSEIKKEKEEEKSRNCQEVEVQVSTKDLKLYVKSCKRLKKIEKADEETLEMRTEGETIMKLFRFDFKKEKRSRSSSSSSSDGSSDLSTKRN